MFSFSYDFFKIQMKRKKFLDLWESGFNTVLFFPDWLPNKRNQTLSGMLFTHSRERTDGFIPFSLTLAQVELQNNLVQDFEVGFHDNRYAKGTLLECYFRKASKYDLQQERFPISGV